MHSPWIVANAAHHNTFNPNIRIIGAVLVQVPGRDRVGVLVGLFVSETLNYRIIKFYLLTCPVKIFIFVPVVVRFPVVQVDCAVCKFPVQFRGNIKGDWVIPLLLGGTTMAFSYLN